MKKNIGLTAMTIAAAALIGWLVYDRFIVSDESRVRRVLATVEKALEEHDYTEFEKHISPEYRDDWDNSAGDLKAQVLLGMREFNTIEVDVSDLKVEVEGARATAVFYPSCRIADAGGTSIDIDEELLQGRMLKLTFEKTERKWLVIRAEAQAE